MERDSIVIVSLNAPREKIWGRLLSLDAPGVTVQGLDLNGFDDWLKQVIEAEPALLLLTTVFYPMHRVERVAQDEASGEIPSIAERFQRRVGIALVEYLEMPHKA